MSGRASHVVQAESVGSVHLYHEERAPVPFQLPPAPRCFVSRQDELAALGGWPLFVVSGPGGVGKTSLALRWLHDRRAEFPDGQLYADLGAHSPDGPVAPADVLEWFLHAFGVRDVPGVDGGQAGVVPVVHLRARHLGTSGQRGVGRQVRPLLPAAGTVVITSRWRLSALGTDGARFVQVEPLDPVDSVRLLETIVKDDRLAAEPDAAAELAELCGGLPVALSVVGARLSARPRRSLGRELSDLRDDRLPELGSDASVGTVLDLSYVDLSEPQARLYRLCAWLPGTQFGAEAAAVMSGDPVGDVREALEDLVEKNLLSEIADDRFRYHDMLRTHARSKPDAARDEGLRRVIEWYVDQAVSADLALMPGHQRLGPAYRDTIAMAEGALEWLESEQANLVAAQRSAHERGWLDLVWQLCEPMWPLFLHRHFYTSWTETHLLAIPAARACGQPLVAARLGNRLAMAYLNLHRYDEAVEELDAVLAAGLDDPVSETTALGLLGRVHSCRGELEAALDCHRRVLEVRIERGRDRGTGLARRRVGEALLELGRASEAVAELEQAEALLTDPVERARAQTFLARACAGAGRLDHARSLLTVAIETLRTSPFHRADAFVVLAEISDDQEAQDHYRSALSCYHDQSDPNAVRIRALLDRHQDGIAADVIPEQPTGEHKSGLD